MIPVPHFLDRLWYGWVGNPTGCMGRRSTVSMIAFGRDVANLRRIIVSALEDTAIDPAPARPQPSSGAKNLPFYFSVRVLLVLRRIHSSMDRDQAGSLSFGKRLVFLSDISSGAAVSAKDRETDSKVEPLSAAPHSSSFVRAFSGVVEEVYDQSHTCDGSGGRKREGNPSVWTYCDHSQKICRK